MARAWSGHPPRRRLPLQQRGNHGVSDGPPKTLSSRFQTLSQAAAGGTAPETPKYRERLAAPAPPAAAERPLVSRPIGGTSGPESFYWHPCRTSASPLSAGPLAMH